MLKVKNTVAELKNAFCGFNSRLDTAEERINEPGDMSTETSQTEIQREKGKKRKNPEQNIQELWDSLKGLTYK